MWFSATLVSGTATAAVSRGFCRRKKKRRIESGGGGSQEGRARTYAADDLKFRGREFFSGRREELEGGVVRERGELQ